MNSFGDTSDDTDVSWKTEALRLLGFPSKESPLIANALEIADDRFIRGLYRSAAVAYGLIHLIWPNQNPWTLFNWKRSLQKAHPDIFDRINSIISEP